ncbi:MAG: hypothetical protein WAM07_11740 [Halobacillus sp.]|uniref:hypothetical protein n=1 Tax=Halobacillus sp. TaxID=56800 RepID=UPI003BAE1C53
MYIEKMDEKLYYLKEGKRKIGHFHLSAQGNGAFKLEQLQVVSQVSPSQILGVFELIQYYAQAQKMDEIHVDSHSGALDHILQHQRFERQDVEMCLWIYRVNHN